MYHRVQECIVKNIKKEIVLEDGRKIKLEPNFSRDDIHIDPNEHTPAEQVIKIITQDEGVVYFDRLVMSSCFKILDKIPGFEESREFRIPFSQKEFGSFVRVLYGFKSMNFSVEDFYFYLIISQFFMPKSDLFYCIDIDLLNLGDFLEMGMTEFPPFPKEFILDKIKKWTRDGYSVESFLADNIYEVLKDFTFTREEILNCANFFAKSFFHPGKEVRYRLA